MRQNWNDSRPVVKCAILQNPKQMISTILLKRRLVNKIQSDSNLPENVRKNLRDKLETTTSRSFGVVDENRKPFSRYFRVEKNLKNLFVVMIKHFLHSTIVHKHSATM